MAPTPPHRKHPNRGGGDDAWDVDLRGAGQRPKRADRSSGWGLSSGRSGRRAGWPDREIAAIAGAQRGLVTHAQLVALGLSRHTISGALARGRLHSRHRGVYSLVERRALPPLAVEQAALLACGEAAFLSHHTAAAVWGLRPTAAGDLDVTIVGRDAGRTRRGIRVHRVQRLDRRDARTYQGIPIISPALVLHDIAPDLDDRELERAFDEALVKRLTTRSAVRAMLAAYPRRPGCRRLMALAREGRKTTATRSGGEESLLALLRRAGLPAPEVNVAFGRWEIDFLWRGQRLAVELDGYDYHSSRPALERNHRKDADLQAAGLLVLRFSGHELTNRPEALLVRVVRALARNASAG